ncbi:FAD:protein FMN transferase [Actinoallomurus sp. NBC_01490]|uniref:FAD:protein FMN transferase n=1 Tax=Actinoallomurus sp. NBC_01490 TaxID=2903557 RepID=UPI002E34C277|nr:FAD:protein FMN transferase [Actinoallomurus sp. NBC_01490]
MIPRRRAEPCMGTVFSFDLRPPYPPDGTLERVIAWLHRIDATFSTYRPDSDISRLGRGEMRIGDCGPEVAEILGLCEELAEVTGGCFSAYARGELDPSGVVKGWAIERAGAMLDEAGCPRYSVGGGGDIRLGHAPEPGRPWRVGIADPRRPGALAAVLTGRDMAVATSGTAERGAHILDPRTGRPPDGGLASMTVVGPSLTLADAYATAAFVMGEGARAWVEDLPGYEAFAVGADGCTWATSGLGTGDGGPAGADRPRGREPRPVGSRPSATLRPVADR